MIEIYSRSGCTFCDQAKVLLRSRSVPFTEKMLGVDFTRDQLIEWFPHATTYPVVVEDGFHIGGYTELRTQLLLKEQLDDHRKLLQE